MVLTVTLLLLLGAFPLHSGAGSVPAAEMTFTEAKTFVLPIGKFKGKTLDKVASTPDGLRYLDWLLTADLMPATMEALETYMMDSSIQKELDEEEDE